jgi:general secretion pathway protein L
VLPRRDIIASLEYKDRALVVKVKPNTVDAARGAAALRAGRPQAGDAEPTPGSWKIVPAPVAGGKS